MSAINWSTLPVHTPLLARGIAVGNHGICFFIGMSGEYVRIHYGPNFQETNGWMPTQFQLYKLDRDLVVTGLDTGTNPQVQQLAFKYGWQWGGDDQSLVHINQPELLFSTRKDIYYHPEPDNTEYLRVSYATFPAAVQMLLTGQTQPVPVTIENILSPDLLGMVRNAPNNPTLRGLLRAHTGKPVPMPVMAEGTDAIIKWHLDNAKELRPWRASPTATVEPATPTARHNERTYPVYFTMTESESGTARYSCYRDYKGTVDVPESVVRQGEDAIDQYVRERMYEYDSETSNYDYDNEEAQDNNVEEFECDAEEVFNNWEEDQPDQPADREQPIF